MTPLGTACDDEYDEYDEYDKPATEKGARQ
jgi:hypothetical protein